MWEGDPPFRIDLRGHNCGSMQEVGRLFDHHGSTVSHRLVRALQHVSASRYGKSVECLVRLKPLTHPIFELSFSHGVHGPQFDTFLQCFFQIQLA